MTNKSIFEGKGRAVQPRSGEELAGEIGPGIELEGNMKVSSGMVQINTIFKGTILSQGTVVIAEQGEMEGEVRGNLVVVLGKVKGAVHGNEQVQILAPGVVLGDLFTPSLVVERGAFFDGQCHMPAPSDGATIERQSKQEEKV